MYSGLNAKAIQHMDLQDQANETYRISSCLAHPV